MKMSKKYGSVHLLFDYRDRLDDLFIDRVVTSLEKGCREPLHIQLSRRHKIHYASLVWGRMRCVFDSEQDATAFVLVYSL